MALAGLEVVSLAVNVITIVETVIKLLEALQQAHERQQNLPKVLQHHQGVLQNTREIVEIILSEDALHIATIRSDLNNIDDLGNSLKQELIKMSRERNVVQQYTHQLLKGSKDTTRLSDIMKGLNLSKDSLVLKIQVVHVGLTKAYGNAIEAMGSLLKQTPGVGCLRLAEFPENGTAQTGGNLVRIELPTLKAVALCGKADVSPAGSEGRDGTDVARSGIIREVIRNKCRNTAFMLNAPIGKERAKHLKIIENEASDDSFMMNHGASWENIKRMKRMHKESVDSNDCGGEDTSDEECRRSRKRKAMEGSIETLPRRNKRTQPQPA